MISLLLQLSTHLQDELQMGKGCMATTWVKVFKKEGRREMKVKGCHSPCRSPKERVWLEELKVK